MINDWEPSEGIEATDELMDIITCNDSVAVLAGAGAGKTELLAQKASYLFVTDRCVWPKRILSLTFKTEAQININERVSKRCGVKANRFDSFTFHAFCKSIVDRFKNTLDEIDRPNNNYDIVFERGEAVDNAKILMGDLFVLALKILKSNDKIRKMFSSSYRFVFVDEFQDTTNAQYELLQLLFHNTDTKLLTVGDINQSIMLWAGARKTVFSDYLKDFKATNKFLIKNYRASKEIQDVLGILLNYINDSKFLPAELAATSSSCSVNRFTDEYQESIVITESIKELIASGVSESDICILTKELSSQYTEILRAELIKSGVRCLDMSDLQDALKEPLGQIFSLFIKALVSPTPKVMTELFSINLALNKVEIGDEKEEELTFNLAQFISLKASLIKKETSINELMSYVRNFIIYLGISKIKGRWKQYKSHAYYSLIWNTLEVHMRNMCVQADSLECASRLFNADNAVQIMNVHKCKGLEYHAVYFVGLEDQAFWKYKAEPFENNCAIYVALSRAKEKLFVTYTDSREHRVKFGYDNRASSHSHVRGILNTLLKKCKFSLVKHTV